MICKKERLAAPHSSHHSHGHAPLLHGQEDRSGGGHGQSKVSGIIGYDLGVRQLNPWDRDQHTQPLAHHGGGHDRQDVKWYKAKGGDVLCDIQTDMAVGSMESDEIGFVSKILLAENRGGPGLEGCRHLKAQVKEARGIFLL